MTKAKFLVPIAEARTRVIYDLAGFFLPELLVREVREAAPDLYAVCEKGNMTPLRTAIGHDKMLLVDLWTGRAWQAMAGPDKGSVVAAAVREGVCDWGTKVLSGGNLSYTAVAEWAIYLESAWRAGKHPDCNWTDDRRVAWLAELALPLAAAVLSADLVRAAEDAEWSGVMSYDFDEALGELWKDVPTDEILGYTDKALQTCRDVLASLYA